MTRFANGTPITLSFASQISTDFFYHLFKLFQKIGVNPRHPCHPRSKLQVIQLLIATLIFELDNS